MKQVKDILELWADRKDHFTFMRGGAVVTDIRLRGSHVVLEIDIAPSVTSRTNVEIISTMVDVEIEIRGNVIYNKVTGSALCAVYRPVILSDVIQ
jgi:DNA-binding protein YbaB